MSRAYKLKLEKDKKVDMRKWCQRPGRRDSNGKLMYFTQQNHKKECDVNYIIDKYDKKGIITHTTAIEARYGDVTGADFRKAQDLFINAQAMFDKLPKDIKKPKTAIDGSKCMTKEEKQEHEKSMQEISLMIALEQGEIKASCQSCFYSGYDEGEFFITCGIHHTNFTSTSFCTDYKKTKQP